MSVKTGAIADIPGALEDIPCPLGCADSQDELVIVGRDRLHKLPGEFKVVRCSLCGLMRTNPRPTAETMGYYYPHDYSPHHRPPAQRLTLRDHIAARAHRLLNAWRIPALPPGRLLEFGCGPGGYLLWMAHQGWRPTGFEHRQPRRKRPSRSDTRFTPGPTPAPEIPYDLSVGWMVVEHLHDPIKAPRNLNAWTRDNGWLAISVPNAASKESSYFGDSGLPSTYRDISIISLQLRSHRS